MRVRRPILRAVVRLGLLTLMLAGAAQTQAQAIIQPDQPPEAGLTGTTEEAPPNEGVTTGDTMVYRLTISNPGPGTISAGSLLLALYVERANDADPVTIEVARFEHSRSLVPAPGGACGNGSRVVVQCTNMADLAANEQITLEVAHRHPNAEAGNLTFVAELSQNRGRLPGLVVSRGVFRGPTYGFSTPPTTTTTTTTTVPSSSTSESSTTSSSTTSSSTTSLSTTTSSTTSTTVPTTTSTSLAAFADSAFLPTGSSLDQKVAGASGSVAEDQVAAPLSPPSESGGPPLALLAAMAALVILLGGVGLAAYVSSNRAPPMFDIRQYDR